MKKKTAYSTNHQLSEILTKKIIDESILQRAAQSYYSPETIQKDSVEKVSNITNSVINLFDEKIIKKPRKWKEERQTKIIPRSFHIKTVINKRQKSQQNQKESSFDESQAMDKIELNKDLLCELTKNTKKKVNIRGRSNIFMKNKNIVPLNGSRQRENDLEAEFQKFLRQSKESKAKYLLKQSHEVISRPKFTGKSDKWLKQNPPQNKKNPQTTDYNGESISISKIDQTKYLSHYTEMDVNVFDDHSVRKKSKKVQTLNSVMLIKNYNKVKEQEATFGRIVAQKFKPKKGVKQIVKNSPQKPNPDEGIITQASDISKMKLSDFLAIKQNKGKIKSKIKQEKENIEFDGDLKKESQKKIKFNQISQKFIQEKEDKIDKTFQGIKINNPQALAFLLNENYVRSKKIVKISSEFL